MRAGFPFLFLVLTSPLVSLGAEATSVTSSAAPVAASSAAPSAGKKSSLSVIDAKKMLDRETAEGRTVKIIDARAEPEFLHAHIPGAENISARDHNKIAEQMDQKMDKNGPILIYSGSGTRSARYVDTLRAKGFQRCWSLEQGLRAWEIEGFPIERGKPKASPPSN